MVVFTFQILTSGVYTYCMRTCVCMCVCEMSWMFLAEYCLLTVSDVFDQTQKTLQDTLIRRKFCDSFVTRVSLKQPAYGVKDTHTG